MQPSLDLLKKYDVPGPRYTSYPTVPAWTEVVGPADFARHLAHIKADEPLSLYFHIPFCERLCHFCGCMQVITKDHSKSRPYVETLCKEIDLVSHVGARCTRPQWTGARNAPLRVVQIHFGGGTPNFLHPDELSQIMQKVRACFRVDARAEISIEMHPKTSTEGFCDRLKEEGFNRISLGVQDFDDGVQRLIHRFQTHDVTRDMLAYLRKIGLEHFNFDLIYGLPGQTLTKFKDTLKKVIALKPNRLAVYSYAHVPWVRPVQRSFKDSDLPPPDLKIRLFLEALNTLTTHGYHLIGMDHFADRQDELHAALKDKTIHRNFMGYTTRANAHLIGFGVSAISHVNGHYFQNTKKLIEYQRTGDRPVAHTDGRAQRAPTFATFRGFLVTREDEIRRDLIARLMCHFEIDAEEVSQKYGIDFFTAYQTEMDQLEPLVRDNLLACTSKKLTVTETGRLFVRNIAMCFDEYLNGIKTNAQNPVFSKTV